MVFCMHMPPDIDMFFFGVAFFLCVCACVCANVLKESLFFSPF